MTWRMAHLFAVPGTGRRSRYCNWLRSPRHIRIKRFLAAFGLRGEKMPPNDWDDIKRGGERSWKAHRRTQWRRVTDDQTGEDK